MSILVLEKLFRFGTSDLVMLGVTAVVMVVISLFLKYGRLGQAIRATAQDQEAALQMGIPVGLIQHVSFVIASALGGLAGVFIALYVWLVRRERVRSRLWISLLLSLGGLVLVAQVWRDGGALDPLGVGAALLAAICLAAYYLLGERGTTSRDPVALTCWSFVAAALFWAVAAPWWDFDPDVLGRSVPIAEVVPATIAALEESLADIRWTEVHARTADVHLAKETV